MKTYKGKLTDDKVGGQKILVDEGGTTYPLPHIERHSPDGFNWGYGGSGPSDTALSILTDCLGGQIAPGLYQDFKWAFVAGWGDEFSITEKEIKDWVNLRRKGGMLQCIIPSLGICLIYYGWYTHHSWQGWFLLITGGISVIGLIFNIRTLKLRR